jgi:hypothetical protein
MKRIKITKQTLADKLEDVKTTDEGCSNEYVDSFDGGYPFDCDEETSS